MKILISVLEYMIKTKKSNDKICTSPLWNDQKLLKPVEFSTRAQRDIPVHDHTRTINNNTLINVSIISKSLVFFNTSLP